VTAGEDGLVGQAQAISGLLERQRLFHGFSQKISAR